MVEFVSKYYIHWNSFGGLLHWSCKSFLNINMCIWQHRFEVWEQIVVRISKLGTWDHQWFAQGQKESLWKKGKSTSVWKVSDQSILIQRPRHGIFFLLTQSQYYFASTEFNLAFLVPVKAWSLGGTHGCKFGLALVLVLDSQSVFLITKFLLSTKLMFTGYSF